MAVTQAAATCSIANCRRIIKCALADADFRAEWAAEYLANLLRELQDLEKGLGIGVDINSTPNFDLSDDGTNRPRTFPGTSPTV